MKKLVLGGLVAGCALLVGSAAGTAVAVGPALFAPTGLSTDSSTQEMPSPKYKINESGLTYGSSADAPSPNEEPDLILVETTAGEEGYVLRSDFNKASGASDFASPEEALRWQDAEGTKDRTIPVYESDGKTVIGEFTIVGSDTQSKEHDPAG